MVQAPQGMSYPPGISSSLPRKLSHLRTPLTNTLLLGASAQQLIFSAQRDTVCALDHGKLSHLAPVHPNLPCSSDPTTNRQSLSLFSRQAPTVSGAEAPPTPVSPPPCTMSPQSWERRGPSALLPGLRFFRGFLQPEQGAGSSRPVSGREGTSGQSLVSCGPRPCGRRHWGWRADGAWPALPSGLRANSEEAEPTGEG